MLTVCISWPKLQVTSYKLQPEGRSSNYKLYRREMVFYYVPFSVDYKSQMTCIIDLENIIKVA